MNFVGFFKNSTISSSSSFSSSTPATSSNVTLFLSVGFNTLALLFPKVIVLFPFWLFAPLINTNQKIKNITIIPIGVKYAKKIPHADSDFSVTVILADFILSCKFSIKLSTLGTLTFFSMLSFLSFTVAEAPPASSSIFST